MLCKTKEKMVTPNLICQRHLLIHYKTEHLAKVLNWTRCESRSQRHKKCRQYSCRHCKVFNKHASLAFSIFYIFLKLKKPWHFLFHDSSKRKKFDFSRFSEVEKFCRICFTFYRLYRSSYCYNYLAAEFKIFKLII